MNTLDFLNLIYNLINNLKWPVLIFLLYISSKEKIHNLLKSVIFRYKGAEIIMASLEEQKTSNVDVPVELESVDLPIKVNATDDSYTKLVEENNRLKVERFSEYTYRIIFKSQILFLLIIKNYKEGLPEIDAQEYFKNINASNTILENWESKEYLHFLYDSSLIEDKYKEGKKYIEITKLGTLFLDHIKGKEYNFHTEKVN